MQPVGRLRHEIEILAHVIQFNLAGKVTTNEELEEMLEHGNSAIFTQGVSMDTVDTLTTRCGSIPI